MLGFEQNADLLVFFVKWVKSHGDLSTFLSLSVGDFPTCRLGCVPGAMKRERESLSIILDLLKAEKVFLKCVKSTMTKESIRECFGVAWDHSKQLSDTSDLI
jgi:hypothetical protein